MNLSLVQLLAFLTVGLVATRAALPPHLYWHSVLLTTPTLSSISHLLLPSGIDVGGIGGGVSVQPPLRDCVGLTPVYNYYDASYDPKVAFFALEQDLKAGHKMELDFTQISEQRPFLTRELADSIPFSLNKLDDILKRFNVKPGSHDAQVMKQTLVDCDGAGVRGEEKYCATSLESMVEFAMSKLGKEVEALSTEPATGKQEYTIAPGVKKVGEKKEVVRCHRQEYPYAVFYCHKTETTTAYKVPLEGADGTRVKAIAVCHTDTSEWNPKHVALRVLNVKPGTVAVCHFLPPQDHLVWVPKRLEKL